MYDIIAALISFFLVDPLQADLSERLAAARAPAAVIDDVTTCAETAVPVMIERATGDPWWAVTSAFGVWTGMADPAAILLEAAPSCAGAVTAAESYLGEGEA
jgi:hypothetical protein